MFLFLRHLILYLFFSVIISPFFFYHFPLFPVISFVQSHYSGFSYILCPFPFTFFYIFSKCFFYDLIFHIDVMRKSCVFHYFNDMFHHELAVFSVDNINLPSFAFLCFFFSFFGFVYLLLFSTFFVKIFFRHVALFILPFFLTLLRRFPASGYM